MFGFEYVISFILITKQSPVILFRAQKQKKKTQTKQNKTKQNRKIRIIIAWSK